MVVPQQAQRSKPSIYTIKSKSTKTTCWKWSSVTNGETGLNLKKLSCWKHHSDWVLAQLGARLFCALDGLTWLTKGEGAGVLVSVHKDRVLGTAPQRLAVPQLWAVHPQGQAVSQRPLVELPTSCTFVQPGQVGAGISPQPGAIKEEVLRVCRRAPHTQRVSVWNICFRGTERSDCYYLYFVSWPITHLRWNDAFSQHTMWEKENLATVPTIAWQRHHERT